MPNLRELKVSIDGRAPNLNLATLLTDNAALESLHLHLVGEGLVGAPKKSGSGQNPNFGDGGGVLRHELQDVLPLRLRKIILDGQIIENIHPAAFKVTPWFITSHDLLSYPPSSRIASCVRTV